MTQLGNLNVVFEGDSRMALLTIPTRVGNYVNAASYVGTNNATGGERWAHIASEVAQTTALYVPGKVNIAVALAGVNDNRSDEINPTVIYGYATTWIQGVRAGGFKAIVCTECDSQEALSVTYNWATVRPALNTLIRANAAGADDICDLGALPHFQDALNTKWYQIGDWIHFTTEGDTIIALKILQSIQRIA